MSDSPGINGSEPPDPVELTRALIRFDTTNPPGNERACIEFLAGILKSFGIEPKMIGRNPERPNLVARMAGRGEAPPLLLHGHVDVVPANAAEWTHPPFTGELLDGELWGRGALDMKSGIAMLVASFLRMRDEGPAGDLILAVMSDEEAGSEHGAKYLVDEHAHLFDGVRFAIGEGGGFTRWIGGRPFYPISVSEKQRCLIRATIQGAGGHASLVVRDTAAGKTGRFLSALERRRLPVHVTPVVRRMLSTIAGRLPLHERLALRPALVPVLTDRLLDLFGKDGDSLDPLLHNTATPTVVRGGESTNVVPTKITVDLDGRLLPGQTPTGLVRELETLVPGLARYEVVREEPAMPAEPDLTLLPMFAAIVGEREPAATPFPVLLPGYTDARHFARLGIQGYGFLPLRLPRTFPIELSHAPDERVTVDAVRWGAECLGETLRRYGSRSTG
jgi:acetylornithine deacetylase/succinyl-diaminopimelate desuccinylase-like protein